MIISPLQARAGHLARTALGAVLGLGLAGAVIFQPVQAFAQTAAASAAPAAEGAGPALWAIRDADSTIYLFGTVHVLRPTTAWGSPKVDAAFASADHIWFEVSNPDDQAAIVPVIQQYGLSPDRPLSTLLTAEELTDLNAAAAAAGLTVAQIDPFRPWLAAVTLSLAPMVKAGYDPQSGVERILKARADAAGTPVHGFETLDKQIGIIAGMSEADQLDFLRATLEAYDDATTELDAMVNAWAAGDIETFKKISVDEMRDEAPAVYQALLVQRNTDWAGQIQALLAGSGTAFIAVGAGHLAGEDSVQEILADRGVAVTREE